MPTKKSENNAERDVSTIFKNDAFARLLLGLAWPTAVSTGSVRVNVRVADLPRPEHLAGLLAKGRQEAIALGADEAVLDRLAADNGLAESCARLILPDITVLEDLTERSASTAQRCYLRPGTIPKDEASPHKCIGNMAHGIFAALVADRRASEPGELSSVLAWLAKDSGSSHIGRMAMENIQNATEAEIITPWRVFSRAVQDLPYSIKGEGRAHRLAERFEAQTYLEEIEGWINARNIMARQALILAPKAPAEGLAFKKSCSARMSLSFAAAGPEASLADLLLKEAPAEKPLTATKRTALSDLRKEGIAGKITLAAAKAFGLQAGTAQGLVGEAKKALFEHCGLSPASWRAAVGSAQIASLLISSLESRATLWGAMNKRENARVVKAAAKEKFSQQIAEEGAGRLRTKFMEAVLQDATTESSDMAVRVANGASAKNMSQESTQRLFAALSHIFFPSSNEEMRGQRVSNALLLLLSGRDPVPSDPQRDPSETKLTIQEIDSVQRQSAQWVQIISDQLNKRVAKALAAEGEKMDSERKPQFSDPKTAEAIMRWAEGQARVERYDIPMLSEASREHMLSDWGISKDEMKQLRGRERPAVSPWVAAHKRALDDLVNDLSLWVDFLTCSPKGYFSTLPDDFGWGTIMRHQEQWHANETARKIDSHVAAGWAWPTPCGPIAEGAFTATPIANGRELIIEGQRMKHCVSSYAERCVKGHSHILSVSKHGAPFSTVELRAFDSRGREIDVLAEAPNGKPIVKVHSWKIVQNRGRYNAVIEDPDALAFAKHASDRYAEAFEAIVNPKAEEAAPANKIAEKARARRQASSARPAPKA